MFDYVLKNLKVELPWECGQYFRGTNISGCDSCAVVSFSKKVLTGKFSGKRPTFCIVGANNKLSTVIQDLKCLNLNM